MNSFCNFFFFLFSFILNGFLINAQPKTHHNPNSGFSDKISFEHYSTRHGLSQNAVYNILEDEKGFIWFGTQDGLNHFNGYGFTAFHHSAFDTTSLCHSFINGIYNDSKDRLWVCTEGGLALYNPLTESFSNFLHDDSNPQSIIDNYVWTIFEDSKGTFWVGTKKGLSSFDPDKKIFEPVKISSRISAKNNSINIVVIFEDSKGNLWFGTRGEGLFKIEKKNNKPITGANLWAEHYSIGNNDVRAIIEDSNGELNIGTFGTGLFKLDSFTYSFYQISIDLPNSISINPHAIRTIFCNPVTPGILWLGTEEDGIILVDTKLNYAVKIINNPKYSNSLSGNMVYAIYQDHSDIIWIGANEGINKLSFNVNDFEHIQREENNIEGLSSNTVNKIIEDHNNLLWIGTDGGGLNKFDRASNKFTHYQHNKKNPSSISNNRAMIVFEDHTGTIWVGTFGGGSE